MIFLLHGYQSSSDDMDRLYSSLLESIPNIKIHSLSRIENINDKGLFELGEIISHEIRFQIEIEIEK